MKRLLALGLLVGSVVCQAGQWGDSGQDPVVSQIRKQFAAAKSPTNDQLSFSKPWQCKGYVAIKDNYEVYQRPAGYYVFNEEVLGVIANIGKFDTIKNYVITDEALIGTEAKGWADSIRVTSNGILISEYSAKNLGQGLTGDPSLIDSARSVHSYRICTPATTLKLKEGLFVGPTSNAYVMKVIYVPNTSPPQILYMNVKLQENTALSCSHDGRVCEGHGIGKPAFFRLSIDSPTTFLEQGLNKYGDVIEEMVYRAADKE